MSEPNPEETTPAKPNPRLVGIAMYHNGPLPLPKVLAAYEQALPGAADRIITMAELDQKAEIHDVRFAQRARFAIDVFGQLFLYGLVVAAVFLAINDKPLEAFFAGLAPIIVSIYASTRKTPNDQP